LLHRRPPPRPMAQGDEDPPPRVLVAGADDPLAEALCSRLVDARRIVRLTHEEPLDWVEEGGPWVQFFEARLQNEVATDVLLTTCSTMVIFPRRGGPDVLDYNTRRMHNLLLSASCASPPLLPPSHAHHPCLPCNSSPDRCGVHDRPPQRCAAHHQRPGGGGKKPSSYAVKHCPGVHACFSSACRCDWRCWAVGSACRDQRRR
jgi:hypothetical protein